MFKHNERIAKAIIAANLEVFDYNRLLVMISESMIYNNEHGYDNCAREVRELFDMLCDYAKQNGHYN